MSETILYATLGYFFLFVVGSVSFALWRIHRQKTKLPMDFKLLRGPGETLRRKLASHDETMLLRYAVAALVPLGVVIVAGKGLVLLAGIVPLTVNMIWVALALVFLAVLMPAVLWVGRDFRRYRATRLGYLGERAVGEQLASLIMQGYSIFHDVPVKGEKKPFNLDHVAVGPSGVAVIETKTRRKGRARPGYKDHEVIYDGQQLIWPWGEDRHGLAQALGEAEWLQKWILKQTGIDTPVKPILALPGWYVVSKARGPVTVVNHKQVTSAVRGANGRLLTDAQIDLIARQLDTLCRDVED